MDDKDTVQGVKDIAEKENENKKEDEKIDINNIKLGPKEEPMVAYEADFLYPKISARQLFKQTVPDKKIKQFIINYRKLYSILLPL